jgi:DNA-binding transcriptional MerR regulator
MNDGERSFDLDELAALSGTPVRTIRFYIQEGLVPRPLGLGRGARYGPGHLEALLAIRRWQSGGLSLERIRQLLVGGEAEAPPARQSGTVEVWSHLVVRPGIELLVEPGQAGLSPEQVRALFRAVLDAVARIEANQIEETDT